MESVVRGMGVRAPAPGGSEVEGSAVQQCSEVKWSAPGPGGTWAFATDTCHRHRRWSTLVSLTRCIFWHYLILFKCFIFRLWQIALLGLKESCVVCENSSQQKKKSWNWSSFFFLLQAWGLVSSSVDYHLQWRTTTTTTRGLRFRLSLNAVWSWMRSNLWPWTERRFNDPPPPPVDLALIVGHCECAGIWATFRYFPCVCLCIYLHLFFMQMIWSVNKCSIIIF